MLINTNGLALIGPGSEWFWSMLQSVIVTVSLVGIYYQLRSARSANAFSQLGGLVDEWNGERLIRKRWRSIRVPRRRGPGGHPGLTGRGRRQLLGEGRQSGAGRTHRSVADRRGPCWGRKLVGDPCPVGDEGADEDANPNFCEHFEWLAGRWCGSTRCWPLIGSRSTGPSGNASSHTESDLRDLEAMRTVIVAPPAPTG